MTAVQTEPVGRAPRPVVRLLCGLTCSGKTTYARGLVDAGWVRLSVDADAWDAGCREQPLPAALQREIKIRHKRELGEHISAGRSVVLDYPLVSRSRRDEYRALALAAGADVEVVFFDVPLPILLDRLAARSAGPAGPDAVRVEPERLRRWSETLEPPDEDEAPIVVVGPEG